MYDWLIAQMGADTVRVIGVVAAFLVAAFAIWLIVILSRRIQNRSVHGELKSRLALSASMAVDAQRRLVIVRRDGVEHLLLIGGPTDIVIESKISLTPLGSVTHNVFENRRDGLVDAVVDDDAAIDFVREKSVANAPSMSELQEDSGNAIEREEALREAALRNTVQREEMRHREAVQDEEEALSFVDADEVQLDERHQYDELEIQTSKVGIENQHEAISEVAADREVHDELNSDVTQMESKHQGLDDSDMFQGKRGQENIMQPTAPMAVSAEFLPSMEAEFLSPKELKKSSLEEQTVATQEDPPFASYFAGQPKHVSSSPEATHQHDSQMVGVQTVAALSNIISYPSTQSQTFGSVPFQETVPMRMQEHAQGAAMLDQAQIVSSATMMMESAIMQKEEREEREEQHQDLSLNPFVSPSKAHGSSVLQTPHRHVPPSYSSSFLGYPVQRFADSSFSTVAAAPEPRVVSQGQRVPNIAPRLYPIDEPPSVHQQEEMIPEQDLVNDFERMLHDELMQPIDSGSKIVSFKP